MAGYHQIMGDDGAIEPMISRADVDQPPLQQLQPPPPPLSTHAAIGATMAQEGEEGGTPPQINAAKQLLAVVVSALCANGLNQLLAWACGGSRLHIMAGLAVGIHYVVLLHASGDVCGNERTEKFYDLTGSATYSGITAYAMASAELDAGLTQRQTLLATLVLVWALRLGVFLFARIRRDGHDPRFTDAKKCAKPALAPPSTVGTHVCSALVWLPCRRCCASVPNGDG